MKWPFVCVIICLVGGAICLWQGNKEIATDRLETKKRRIMSGFDWSDGAMLLGFATMVFAMINIYVVLEASALKKYTEAQQYVDQGYAIMINGEKITQLPDSLMAYGVNYNHEDQVIVITTAGLFSD